MRFLSLFSGIEAASAAWLPLGWQCIGVSEIEPFPCTALRQRHPDVSNLGDITTITEAQVAHLGQIDVIVFGSPCQDLSVAGKRKGFTDEDGDFTRSGLFFAAMRVIAWARVHCGLRFALWENVPGAFSSNGGADFAAVVGHLGGMEPAVPPKGWGTEGAAVGTEAMVEWSTLDAQWFGVAQRRRRVFALADFGDWAGRPPILLESEGMRGNSAPRRGPGEGTAAGTLRSSDGGCDVDHVRAGHAVAVDGLQRPVLSFGGNNTSGPIDVATALNACGTATGRLDFESETFVLQPVVSTLDASYARLQGCSGQDLNHGHSHLVPMVSAPVARSVERPRGDGLDTLIAFDSRQDCVSSTEVFGSLGSSSPQAQAICFAIQAGALRTNPLSGPDGVGVQEHIAYTLEARAEVQAVCFAENSRAEVRLEGGDGTIAGALSAGGGKPGQGYAVIYSGRRVRRLTPRECERLQGFPDDHTLVQVRGKPAADGPRYKALGNSMAVPVMAWIGRQIDFAMLFDVSEKAGAEDLFA